MKTDTNKPTTFGSLTELLAKCNAHPLTNCIRIYHDAIVQHSLTVEVIKPLLPAELDVYPSKITPKDILEAQVKAQISKIEYVEPKPYLVISVAKDRSQEITNTLNRMLDPKATVQK